MTARRAATLAAMWAFSAGFVAAGALNYAAAKAGDSRRTPVPPRRVTLSGRKPS